MDVSHFFERPILVKSYEWDDNTDFFQSINLWTEYFTHRVIWPKLLGFSRMTANLEVELRINGSSFRFGDILASYRPLFNPDIDGFLADYSGGYLPEDGCYKTGATHPNTQPSANAYTLIARSQRQSTYLVVSQSIGAKMVFPFVYPFEALRMTSLEHNPAVPADVTKMKATTFYKSLDSLGRLTMESLSPLRNTQLATNVGVTIDVFVRAVNVHVWLASGAAALKPQGKKIAGKGGESIKPSQVSAAVAVGAKAFKDIPVIGPLATVGSMVAEGFTTLLKAFGFTPMPINLVVQPVARALTFIQPSLFAPRNIEPLSLDHQNQVTIDPKVCGGPPIDELSFASFCSRSSIAFVSYFGPSCVVDSAIALIPVHPMLGAVATSSSTVALPSKRYQLLPCAMAAMNFRYWRGTMVLKLRAIKTNFHKGRLRVTWEPELGDSQGSGNTSLVDAHEGYQQMLTWDLAASDCLTMKVGFAARSGRLTVPPLTTVNLLSSGTSWLTNSDASSGPIANPLFLSDNYLDYANGFVRISVLNRLQATDLTYAVPIVASIHFEDLELYDPVDVGPDANFMQYAEFYDSNSEPDVTRMYGPGAVASNLCTRRVWPDSYYPQGSNSESIEMFEFQPSSTIDTLVYEGELITSFRSLAARETYYDTLLYEVPASHTKVEGSTKFEPNSLSYVPTIISTFLPWRPYPVGSVSPMRATTATTNGASLTYNATAADGTVQVYRPSLARTPISCLIAECFVGQRGSYNWKFLPGPSQGVEIDAIFASRSNAMTNFSYTGSFPRAASVAPFNGTPTPDTSLGGFTFITEKRTTIVPLGYDTGGTFDSTDTFSLPRALRKNISQKLSTLRYVLNGLMPNFGAAGICANRSERRMLGIRFPYFSMTKFLPSSVVGWMSKYGNSELASNLRLNIVTAAPSGSSIGSSPNYTDTNWRVHTTLPPRAYVSVHMLSSIGDDWSVSNFVNVPTLHLTPLPVAFSDPVEVNS